MADTTLPAEAKLTIAKLNKNMREVGRASSILANISKRSMENLKNNLQIWGNLANECKQYIVSHYHNDHGHGYCHELDEDDENRDISCRHSDNYGQIIDPPTAIEFTGYTPVTAVDRLRFEYDNWQDADLNGFVFGRDFLFDPKDTDIPFELRRIQLKNPKLFYNRPIISWNQYLSLCPSQCPWMK